MKKLILLGALVAAHALAFAQKNFIDQPFVEVSAKADSLVVPDRIYLSIRIEEASSKNRKSVEEQEKQMLSALRRAGINTDKDLGRPFQLAKDILPEREKYHKGKKL